MIAPPLRPRPVDGSEMAKASSRPEPAVISANLPAAKFVPLHETSERAKLASHRKLFADPGQWRVLCWGEFKELLARQLAHPERLRNRTGFRATCKFWRLSAQCRSKNWRRSINQKTIARPVFIFLDEITARLDLVLPLRAAPPPNVRCTPNTLLPHERVFRLIVADDPTVDVANNKASSTSRLRTRRQHKSKEKWTSANDLLPQEHDPTRLVKDWEFRIGREEASYDMDRRAVWKFDSEVFQPAVAHQTA